MKPISLVSMLIVAGATLGAQEVTTGSLLGVVRDAHGKPLAEATVTLSSPALFANRVLKTNERGEWRTPLLPPGYYKVTATLKGYVGSGSENVRVGVGATGRVDLALKSMTVQEAVVEVVAQRESVGVDKASTVVSENFSGESLVMLPVASRTFEGAAELAPGAVASGGNGELSIRGGMTNSTLYRINGVDIKNDYQGARTATGALEDMIEDVQVVLSPLNARNGRTTGGAINVVTKSGSNTFAGSVRLRVDRASWKGLKNGLRTSDVATAFSDDLNRVVDVTLLGPIIPDRVWFSMATRITPNETLPKTIATFGNSTYRRAWRTKNNPIDAITLNGPQNGYAFTLFDAGKNYNRIDEAKYYEGKLTFAIMKDHTVELSGTYEKETLFHRDTGGPYATVAMLGDQKSQDNVWGVGYRGILTPRLFVEARYNSFESQINWPTSVDPVVQDPFYVNVLDSNSSTLIAFCTRRAPIGPELRGNRGAEVNCKYFMEALGQHDMDFGAQWYEGRRGTVDQYGPNNRRFRVGGAYMNGSGDYLFPTIAWTGGGKYGQTSNGYTGLAPVMEKWGGQDGENNTENLAFYVNDQWALNSRLSVMVGLRYETLKVVDSDGTGLAKSHAFSPRVQVKWDPFGDEEHLVTLSAARFNEDFLTGLTRAFATTGQSNLGYVGWTGAALQQPLPGTASDPFLGVRFVGYQDFANMDNWKTNGVYNTFSVTSTKAYIVDPNLRPPEATELSLGYVRNFGGRSSVGLTYTHRQWRHAWAFARDYRPDQWLTFTDPLGSGKQIYVQSIRVFNSDKLTRRYQGLDLNFQHGLSDRWTFHGLVSLSHLTGNDQSGDGTDTSGFRDNAINEYYNERDYQVGRGLPDSAFAPEGFLLAHQLLKGRLSLVGRFPVGKGGFVSFAWMAEYDTGARYDAKDTRAFGMATITSPDPAIAVPTKPTTYMHYYNQRGAYGYNDFISVDFKMAWQLPLGVGRLSLIGDVFVNNLLNHNVQNQWYAPYTSASGGSDYLGARYSGGLTEFGTTRPGNAASEAYYNSARTVSMSIGLKF